MTRSRVTVDGRFPSTDTDGVSFSFTRERDQNHGSIHDTIDLLQANTALQFGTLWLGLTHAVYGVPNASLFNGIW